MLLLVNTLLAIDTGLEKTAQSAGFGGSTTSLPVIIGKLVNYLLGALGLAFLILLLWGGILWMLSGGDQEKVKKAQRMLVNSTIAIVIIVASYTIAQYVVSALTGALTS